MTDIDLDVIADGAIERAAIRTVPYGNVLQLFGKTARSADRRDVGAGPNDRLTGLEHGRTRLKLRAQAEIGWWHGGVVQAGSQNLAILDLWWAI